MRIRALQAGIVEYWNGREYDLRTVPTELPSA
jgi:hypothetical protein